MGVHQKHDPAQIRAEVMMLYLTFVMKHGITNGVVWRCNSSNTGHVYHRWKNNNLFAKNLPFSLFLEEEKIKPGLSAEHGYSRPSAVKTKLV